MVASQDSHPLRWADTFPAPRYISEIVRPLRNGQLTAVALQQTMNQVMVLYNHAIDALPFEQRPVDARFISKEAVLALNASRFFCLGRNLFEMTQDLAESLDHSTLGDVKGADLKLPHKFFWVSLKHIDCGGLPGAENTIDGVYVDATMPFGIQFWITARRKDGGSRSDWPLKPEPYFYVPCQFTADDDRTFEQILTAAISDGEIKMSEEFAHDLPVSETATRVDSEHLEYRDEIEIDGQIKQVQWRDVTRLNDLKEIENNRKAMPNARRALSVVVNLLAFLSLDPAEIDTSVSWPEDAPRELVDQTINGRSSGARQRAEEQLVTQHFNRIRLIGMKHSPAHLRSDPTGRELEYGHWRIGHFKTQAYGPKRSLRRVIWVKSYRVKPDRDLKPGTAAREYLVEQRRDLGS
jgi:hypothetical protein